MAAPNLFGDVIDFHNKFGVKTLDEPGFPSNDVLNFRIGFMQEELDEFITAVNSDDLENAMDALIDLVYVALGTAHIMNLPFYRGWREVVRANMSKVPADSAASSKRGYAGDIIKPEGWVGPNHGHILDTHRIACSNQIKLASKKIEELLKADEL